MTDGIKEMYKIVSSSVFYGLSFTISAFILLLIFWVIAFLIHKIIGLFKAWKE
jgi:hypothetical protein